MTWLGRIQRYVANALPSFMSSANIGRGVEAFGATLDDAIDELSFGLRLSQPLRCDASAIPHLARDRGIPLYSNEPEASKRYRLSRFWQIRRQWGTAQGELRTLLPMFLAWPGATELPMMRIVHQAPDGRCTWHTLDPSALGAAGLTDVHAFESAAYSWTRHDGNWDWDGAAAKWSRFWLIVYTDKLIPTPQPEWDGGQEWDGGEVWDGLFTLEQLVDALSSIAASKAAHSILWGVILATDPASFDPTADPVTDADGWTSLPAGQWYSTIDPGTGKPTRLPTCSVVYNRGKG